MLSAEESPPSTSSVDRRKSVAREGRQGRRNDTVRNEDESVAEDVVAGFGETATPHRSKSKHGRTLSQMPLKQKGAYGGDLASLFYISGYTFSTVQLISDPALIQYPIPACKKSESFMTLKK